MSYETARRPHPPRPHQRAAAPARAHVPGAPRMRDALHVAKMHRTHHPVIVVSSTQLADYDGLAFSLKPPKSIRKIGRAIKKAATIKNIAKVAAIGGAIFAAPVLLPALAHGAAAGAGLLARGAVSGAGLLARGAKGIVGGLLPHSTPVDKGNGSAIPDDYAAMVARKLMNQGGTAPTAPTPGASGPAAAPTQPASSGGGGESYGGGAVTMPSADTLNPDNYGGTTASTAAGRSTLPDDAAPEAAGAGSGANLLPLIIGGVALLALASKSRPRRA